MYDIQHFHESRISPMRAAFWEGGTREMQGSLKEQHTPSTTVAVCPLAMLLISTSNLYEHFETAL